MAGFEKKRLKEDKLRVKNWKRWGPYLSERQWGTVREDYSENGDCWNYFTHDQARSRAYRWGEDGLLGITDRQCRLCMALCLWNTKDPILKERLFGLNGHEGNHGEDVKELYYYLDNTPTHSYMKALYKYPQGEFPYSQLKSENGRRTVHDTEFELLDTGLFDENRYFDVMAEYCKGSPNDILVRYTISNRGPDRATIHVLPTVWFRNVWSWGDDTYDSKVIDVNPMLQKQGPGRVTCEHPTLGTVQQRCRLNSMGQYVNYAAEEFGKVDHHSALVNAAYNADVFHTRTSEYPYNPFSSLIGDTSSRNTQAQSYVEDGGIFLWEVNVCPLTGEQPPLLFTDNNTNSKRLFKGSNASRFVKDAFHDYVIEDNKAAVNPKNYGTKSAAHYVLDLAPGQEVVIKARLYQSAEGPPRGEAFTPKQFDRVFAQRKHEADCFYEEVISHRGKREKQVSRQACAGLLWSKQFYYYIVKEWLDGDENQPTPPASRKKGRNAEWVHLHNRDIISMPDKWEYPWYASWDLAFHMIPMSLIDIQFAKSQLYMLLREWYMHPNGQIPAYEFAFGDVNPPVHAYAVLKVYKASGMTGKRDFAFLTRCYHKLVVNFTWWVNRKDVDGKNIFSGGFLGLDNIGVFDRSKPLPTGGCLAQADATAWMAFFCSIMLEISLILAQREPIYQDMASKFFEHFLAIVDSANNIYNEGLWDESDGFYYDHVRDNCGWSQPLKIKSMVGLVPLFCTMVIKDVVFKRHPGFHKRCQWLMDNRTDLTKRISCLKKGEGEDQEDLLLLSVLSRDKLVRLLKHILDEDKFLSPYGIRSLSKEHKDAPYNLQVGNHTYSVKYEPGESESKLFGGNSNWRGPIWLPMNYLIIENLQRFYYFYGDTLRVECPTRSGHLMTLKEVAFDLSTRLTNLFVADNHGHRPSHGGDERYATDPHFTDLNLFYEYFHGDTGRGLGASHQTGWTALVVNLLEECSRYTRDNVFPVRSNTI